MAGVINSRTRKVIKGMVVTCQTAQFVSLMPKPKDFVTRIVGDVVYLSAKVQKLSDDINKLLDQYANIPSDYIMVQVNSITGSASSIVNRANTYTQNAINQTMSIGENSMKTISELTGDTIDIIGETSKAVTSLGMAVSHTSAAILGKEDVATDIHDASEVILEWTGDKFKTIKENAIRPIDNVTKSIVDQKTKMMNNVNSVANGINDEISKGQKWVENLLKSLKDKMDKLSNEFDSGFKDVTGINSIANGSSYVNEALKESDNKRPSAQAVTAVSESLAHVLKNFSIAKVVKAFGGVAVQSVIVKTGLDQLPPIDFETMLYKIRDDVEISNEDLYKELSSMTDSAYNDIIEFGQSMADVPSEEKEYGSTKYKEFVQQFNDELKKQRDEIRLSMKNRRNGEGLTSEQFDAKTMRERRALKSAIKEVRKFKKQVKNAKQSSKFMDIINEELKNFKKEVDYKCNCIRTDWTDMMEQYRTAIKEIKKFFQNGGDGDMFIDDCCDAINDDCDKIKQLCKDLITQLTASTIKVAMPSDIGTVVPNPAYKIADFWMDIKTIIKFIKDLIDLIMDILNNINKLARIMLNGINNLSEIIKQLMELLGIKWFMDLIQSIIDFFGGKMTDARALLSNMLSPVHYSETEEYENTLETLEATLSEDGSSKSLTSEQLHILTDENRFYEIDGGIVKDIKFNRLTEKKYEELLDDLDKAGDKVVAYKSPILAYSENDEDNKGVSLSEVMSGKELDSDVKFIGWHFFHPNLDYKGSTYYQGGGLKKILRKIKSRIIKKASKTGNKKRGGINMLKRRKVKKDTAYKAFYWYTYYTEDLEKDNGDCFEMSSPQNSVKIDSIVQTQNGSIVELYDGRKVFVSDNMVKSGDYVTVDGVKYRVK